MARSSPLLAGQQAEPIGTPPECPSAPGAGSSHAERAPLQVLQAALSQYRDRIITFLARFTRDFQLAEEIAQDVFVAFYRESPRIPPSSVGAWLYKAAHHRAIDEARRRRRRPSLLWLEDLELEPRAVPDPPDGGHVSRILERAIGELPARFREVFLLCEVEALPQEQVASILRCPKKTVSTRLFRARQRILKHVTRKMDKEGVSYPSDENCSSADSGRARAR
ncbi:MAG: RNA polymerase sigma factor [Planctomycetota bacterium]